MYHISKLKNGITLITVPVKGTKATTVLAMFPVGSRYEEQRLSGASHFVEHMMFKGTEKRPTALDISRALESVGADYNAFTYKDYTGYYVKIDSTKQELAFDVISDMIYHSRFDKDEIEREKGVIVEELRMYEDNPTMAVDMLFDHVMFKEHPLGRDIGGTPESVRSFSREDLFVYYQTHYRPNSMVLVVAGNINSPKIRKYLKYFEQDSAPKIKEKISYIEKYQKFIYPGRPVGIEERVAVKERKVDQAHVILGFPGLSHRDPMRFADAVLLTILGGGMSSRLFVEVREKRGLAYMIRSGSSGHRDTGAAYIQAGLDTARLYEAIKVIQEELLKAAKSGVTGQELREAKDHIIGRMALSAEDSSTQAEWFAKQFLFMPKIETMEEVAKKLKKVTAREVQRLAEQLFNLSQMRLAVIGPMKKEEVLGMIKLKK